MTLEKAKKIIKSECYIADLLDLDRTQMVNTALDMAIKALEAVEAPKVLTRQEADAVINLVQDTEQQAYKRGYDDGVDAYAKHIGLCEEEGSISRWIPCSERLPKADEYVGDVAKYYLVQNEYGDMLVARYTHSGYWEQIYQLKPIGDEVIAWRELPAPYKEKERGEDD